MPFNKPLDAITEIDLQALVDNEVSEGKTVEYKQFVLGNTRDDKKEFLADVSSFANASGGYLIFGIKEEAGIAVEVCGLQDIDADAEVLRLENLLRDNLDPRVPGISMRAVPLAKGVAIVIHIPHSWAQPHVVNFSGHWRFYSRNSAGKYPLDVSEIRTAFTLSETIADRIRNFRAERLGNIVTGETPVFLQDGAKVVLHIIPINAFDPASKFDVASLVDNRANLAPIHSSGGNSRHNFDGFLTYSSISKKSLARSYLQVFRNGIIESVDTELLSHQVGETYIIPSVAYERAILEALPRFLNAQKQLGVSPPLFIMLSLLEVFGYTMAVNRSRFSWPQEHPIDKKNLIIPDIMIENFDSKLAKIMRPALDAIWNATGWPRSMNYNDGGEWVGH